MKQALLAVLLASSFCGQAHHHRAGECFHVQLPDSVEFRDFKILEVRGHSYLFDEIDYHPAPPPGWTGPWSSYAHGRQSIDFAFGDSMWHGTQEPDCDRYEDAARIFPPRR